MMSFDTSVLDKAQAKRRAKWEQERQRLLARLLLVLDELANQFDLHQAYILGSLIRPGRFTKYSDVNVAVVTLPPDRFFAVAAALSVAMERDVDLVELSHCHFAEKIRRESILWTASD